MHPELFTIPVLGISIKTYGFCMMVGFLSAVWWAMRRAQRVQADPDTVLDLSFITLLFGVGGARVFYVIHYWDAQFAVAPNRLLAVLDITQGGLEFLGGFLGALIAMVVCAHWKKVSLRLYLDILAPSCMWGLAFGRLGCFFNGCCFGGLCVEPSSVQPAHSWAVQFPFASPAQFRQWEDRKVTVPAELVVTSKDVLEPWLLPQSMLFMPVEKREGPTRQYERLKKRYEQARAQEADAATTAKLQGALKAAKTHKEQQDRKLQALKLALQYPSRVVPTRTTSVWELQQLAAGVTSLPVHPTQLYSSVHALLLAALLSTLFYRRRRHGAIIGALFVLYPIPRILLELIRVDNPHDVAGLTVSQSVSLGLLVGGILYLIVLYKWMPERSPLVTQTSPQ